VRIMYHPAYTNPLKKSRRNDSFSNIIGTVANSPGRSFLDLSTLASPLAVFCALKYATNDLFHHCAGTFPFPKTLRHVSGTKQTYTKSITPAQTARNKKNRPLPQKVRK
jgi:hypothetical protein